MNNTEQTCPGPSWVELINDLPRLLSDRLTFIRDLHTNYGEAVSLPLLPQGRLMVFHPDLIKSILVDKADNYCKGRTFKATDDFLEDSVSTSEGSRWIEQRKAFNAHFHREAVRDLDAEGRISAVIAARIEALKLKCAGSGSALVNVSREFRLVALAVALDLIFGAGLAEHEMGEIVDDMHVVLDASTDLSMLPLPLAWAAGFKSPHYHRALGRLRGRAEALAARSANFEASRCPVLRLINGMPGRARLNNSLNMLLGGTDTVANTMIWTALCLQRHPQIFEKVAESLYRSERSPADVQEHGAYLDAVIAETLRLFPQNWMMSRDALADDVVAGYRIKAGTTVYLAVYEAQRRADFWSEGEIFKPERFIGDTGRILERPREQRHPGAYLPFGLGQRRCLGSLMAQRVMPEVLSRLYGAFELTLLEPDGPPVASFTLRPRRDVLGRLRLSAVCSGNTKSISRV